MAFQIEGIWSAKDMESLDRPERRELVKTDREAPTPVSRLKQAKPFTQTIVEVQFNSTFIGAVSSLVCFSGTKIGQLLL